MEKEVTEGNRMQEESVKFNLQEVTEGGEFEFCFQPVWLVVL